MSSEIWYALHSGVADRMLPGESTSQRQKGYGDDRVIHQHWILTTASRHASKVFDKSGDMTDRTLRHISTVITGKLSSNSTLYFGVQQPKPVTRVVPVAWAILLRSAHFMKRIAIHILGGSVMHSSPCCCIIGLEPCPCLGFRVQDMNPRRKTLNPCL